MGMECTKEEYEEKLRKRLMWNLATLSSKDSSSNLRKTTKREGGGGQEKETAIKCNDPSSNLSALSSFPLQWQTRNQRA